MKKKNVYYILIIFDEDGESYVLDTFKVKAETGEEAGDIAKEILQKDIKDGLYEMSEGFEDFCVIYVTERTDFKFRSLKK